MTSVISTLAKSANDFLGDHLSSSQVVRDGFFLLGMYYLSKTTLTLSQETYKAIKTYVLPAFWPRNFKKEYGQWAGSTSQGGNIKRINI